MKRKNEITLGSLFDGIGGFPYAASFYGIKTLWASEIIPAAVSVTRRHFPGIKHLGDITKLNGGKIAPVDIITFGSPCQSFSIAGQRSGLEGKSGLFWEAIRIIKEMREATNGKYPRYCVFENVPGILSANRGRDYQTVLEAFTEAKIPIPPSGRWTNAGMVRGGGIDCAWVIHDAQYFGVAQRRRRLFAVCDFTGQRAAEILFKPKSVHGYFTQGDAAGKSITPNAPGSVRGASEKDIAATLVAGYGNHWNGNDGAYEGGNFALTQDNTESPAAAFMGGQSGLARSIAYNEKLSPTLKSGAGGNMVPCVCEPLSKVTVINDQGGDSFNIEKKEVSPTLRSETHGNLPIVVGVNQNADGDVRTSETAYALTTSSNASGRNAPLVAYGFDLAQITSKENRTSIKEVQPPLCTGSNPHVIKVHPEIAGTLVASGAGLSRPAGMGSETDLCIVTKKPDDPNPAVCGTLCAKSIAPNGICNETDKVGTCDVVAYCLQGNMIGRKDQNGPQGDGVNEDVSFTLNTVDKHCVAAVDCRNLYETAELSGTLQAKSMGGGYSLNYQNPVRKGYIVRRLTPVECERLQGYPDGWTEYGHDSKPLSDTARYQALGNSVAIPCVAYVLSGIADEFNNKS